MACSRGRKGERVMTSKMLKLWKLFLGNMQKFFRTDLVATLVENIVNNSFIKGLESCLYLFLGDRDGGCHDGPGNSLRAGGGGERAGVAEEGGPVVREELLRVEFWRESSSRLHAGRHTLDCL